MTEYNIKERNAENKTMT